MLRPITTNRKCDYLYSSIIKHNYMIKMRWHTHLWRSVFHVVSQRLLYLAKGFTFVFFIRHRNFIWWFTLISAIRLMISVLIFFLQSERFFCQFNIVLELRFNLGKLAKNVRVHWEIIPMDLQYDFLLILPTSSQFLPPE